MRQRIIVGNVLKGMGMLGIALFFLGSPESYFFFIGSAAALFLGLTDFGRRCPLFLSVRHLIYRMKSKKESEIL